MNAATRRSLLGWSSEAGSSDADADLERAVAEVDRSLIRLALTWTLRERLQAGTAMARLAARFRRAAPEGR